ncbi:MAG: DUF1801 domain-containing protein [Comamonadaceae bacterium]|nr:DUF1801 domain-containing protein [Comamonadaceae bacterium]
MQPKSVEALLEDIRFLSEDRHATVQAVRSLMKKLAKPLSEEVKYGGILFASGVQFGGVFAYKDHVSVEFSRGASITDTWGHLQGGGKLRRHIKLKTLTDIETTHLADYIPLALQAAQDAT